MILNPFKRNIKLSYYGWACIISLIILFFTGSTFYHPTLQGIQYFPKGLDIAGGVKLTYKVDFSKYKEIYTNPSEYQAVKHQIQTIVLNNIDKRISKLGVSDYSATTQTLRDGNEYIVIEIGGVADLEQAKSIIGKTVELEFKVAQEGDTLTVSGYLARQKIADDLLKDVVKTPSLFEQLSTGRKSDDVYSMHFKNATLEQLPLIYQTIMPQLETTESGTVYPNLFKGVYVNSSDASGNDQMLSGFVIVKYNGKSLLTGQSLTPQRFTAIAKQNGFEAKQEFVSSQPADAETNPLFYDDSKQDMFFYEGPLLAGRTGYNVQVYAVPKDNMIGKSQDQINQMIQAKKNIADQFKSALEQGKILTLSGVTKISDGWVDQDQLKKSFLNFNYDPQQRVLLMDDASAFFVVRILDQKLASQNMFASLVVHNINQPKASALKQSLNSTYAYDIQDVFVRDRNSWVSATDPKTKEILNGAFFKFASVGQAQTGKPIVSISFNDKGKEIFCDITSQMVGKPLAIFVGGILTTAPVIREKICGGSAQIDGDFTVQTAKVLTDNLNEGALPVALLLTHEEKISPTLGAFAFQGALIAAGIGLLLIFGLMFIMFGFERAVIALISLCVYLIILTGILKLIGYSLSLSGMAAIILNIGLGIDAAILIFERLREEIKNGKKGKAAIVEACNRSWSAIRDGNISAACIGLVLFLVGTNIFKGFGSMMILNVIVLYLVNLPLIQKILLYRQEKKKS